MDENNFGEGFFENKEKEEAPELFNSPGDKGYDETENKVVLEETTSEPVEEPFLPEEENKEAEGEELQAEAQQAEAAQEADKAAQEVQTPSVTYVGNNAGGANPVNPAYTNLNQSTYNPWQQNQNGMPSVQPNSYPAYNRNPYQAPNQANGQPANQQPNQVYGGQNPNQYQTGGYMGAPNNYRPAQQQYVPAAPKNNGGKTVIGIIIIVCLALAIGGMVTGLLLSGGDESEDTNTTASTTQPQAQVVPSTTTENIEVSTTQPTTAVINSVFVAEKVRPSVVGVMEYYDGKLVGEGSGVLMSEDKNKGITYVVTCAHVISDEGVTYGILLLDGTNLEAEMVAYDQRTDIGVLKVKKTGLPLAEFGDSSTLRIGEPVYAIGNPGGSEYFGSITNGIVASIDRSVTSTYTMTCIQHNAAINPGNSGGALVNSAGQVIGINSSKIASTEYEGMGFAVPTSIAGVVVDSLIQYGYVPNRPKLGIEYAPVSSYQLYGLVVSIKGLPQGSLVIAGISEDSSLAGTEAQVGDLIIAVNGKKMDDSSVLLDFIEKGSVGDKLTLTLCRIENRTYKTTNFDVTITLVEDKPSKTEPTEASTQYDEDGYYHGGSESFDDFFNDYFGW